MELKELAQALVGETFVKGTASAPRKKQETKDGRGKIWRVRLKPVQIGGNIRIQVEEQTKTQVFHSNRRPEELEDILEELAGRFGRINLYTAASSYEVMISKKGKMTIRHAALVLRTDGMAPSQPAGFGERTQQMQASFFAREHNRSKRYAIREGEAVGYMVDLGVMTPDGRVVRSRYDKFRQINRFLEMVDDILPELSMDRENVILDFGCGKSYLTFAMYDFIHVRRGYPVRMIGMDLKKDVIENCSRLAQKYGYEHLTFQCGDISGFCEETKIDMMVTLHACDTATDIALAKAAAMEAKVILSVPCCQHELNRQIGCEALEPILSHGILKERMSSLVTDGLRAGYMELAGYRTHLLEFIDMEHTPKNILIRAVKKDIPDARLSRTAQRIRECEAMLQVDPSIRHMLQKEGVSLSVWDQTRDEQAGSSAADTTGKGGRL